MRQRVFMLIVLLLLGSTDVVVGQRTQRQFPTGRLKAGNSASKVADRSIAGEVSKSPSSKLVIKGAHVGLLGVLQIEADMSLTGPLLVGVSAGSTAVPQPGGDSSGVLELPLTRRRSYAMQLRLANGVNVIKVIDAGDPNETAALEWIGISTAASSAPDTPGTLGTVPPRDSGDPRVRSASGRLSVVPLHTNDQATLDVTVGTLKGPFTIDVIDDSKKVVLTRKKSLARSDTSFVETLPLNNGQFSITITSDDKEETAETVNIGPWTIQGPSVADSKPKPPAAFKPNDFQQSEKGNLSAAVTRVDGSLQLKIHTAASVKGFKIKVVDKDDKEVEARTFSDLERTINDWSLRLRAAEGKNTVTVSTLDGGEVIELDVPAVALLKPIDTTPTPQETVEYDWGRVRGYFAGGMIFSKERDDFSHSDMFLDFTLDKNYVARPWFKIWRDTTDENGDVRHHYLFKDFNTFFNARLTSIPVTAKDTTESGNNTQEECNTPDCQAFITSKKAALMQAGIYLPMYWHFTSWYRYIPRENKTGRWEKNALFVAPLAKGGIMTVTGDRKTAEAEQFGQDDVFNFYSFGAMLGHFRLHARKKRDAYGEPMFYKTGRPIYESNPNIAPELISWLTLSIGRWENFEIEVPTGEKDAMGHDIKVRQRPWRYEALGRLKIPETPFIIGFDGNFGKGPDDVRFIFGTRFDIGKIMRTLKLASAEGSLGQSPSEASTPAPGSTPPQP